MGPHMTLQRLALLLPLLALGAMPRAPFHLQDVLPETTLVFVETPSAPEFREAFKKTPMARLLEDEEVRAFLSEAFASSLQAFSPFVQPDDRKDFSWERIFESVSGQVAAAMPSLVAGGKKEPDLVVTIDCSEHAGFGAGLLSRVTAKYEKNGKKSQTWKAGAVDVRSFAIQPDLNLHAAVAAEILLFTSAKSSMESLAAAIQGGQPKPLARAASFLKAREKAAAKEVFLYADVAGFVKEAKEDLEEGDRKFIAALGLDGFTTAAGGISIGAQGVTERFFLGTTGEKKGLAKFLSLKGPAAGFEAAPQDALQFVSFSIELSELYDTVF